MDTWDSVAGFFKEIYGKVKETGTNLEEDYKKKIKEYQLEANDVAKQLGFDTEKPHGHNDELDAFRHAYASAKVTQEQGNFISKAGGIFHEVKGQIQDFRSDDPHYDQPISESWMDLLNNRVGRSVGDRAVAEKWNKMQVGEEIMRLMKSDRMQTTPPKLNLPSILDYYNKSML